MLINLSNHPVENWSHKQLTEAKNLFGQVQDLPFPQINTIASEDEIKVIANKYTNICMEKLSLSQNEINAVHIMGELTFTFALVKKLLKQGIICVASTTERNSIETGGKKITEFRFVRFREYM